MSTHSITIELEEGSYNILQKLITEGRYPTASEAIADVIPDLLFDLIPESGDSRFAHYQSWLDAEIDAAIAEDATHPQETYTLEEVRAALAQRRPEAS